MIKKVMKCGVMSKENFMKRAVAIAKGQYKPSPDEPTVWFESPQAMAQVLSVDNLSLLKIILDKKPKSIQDLANSSGRAKSNLSRTLKTMSKYGIVSLKKIGGTVVPVVMATDFFCHLGISSYAPFVVDGAKDERGAAAMR